MAMRPLAGRLGLYPDATTLARSAMCRLLPLVALLALGGCDAFSTGIRGVDLNVGTDLVAPGGDVIAVLDNDSGRAVAYSCPQLGRLVDGAFVSVTPNMVCAEMLTFVEAGGTVVLQVGVAAGLPEGEYVVGVEVGRGVPDETITSVAFRVARTR